MWSNELLKKWTLRVLFVVFCVGILAAAVPLVLRIAMNPYLYFSLSSVPPAQAAMILGASVEENKVLSPILEARADSAIALYRAHIVSKILVSGDNATVSYNEVSTVGRYLSLQGIPSQDIFLDHAGFDTYSSMYRARQVFAVSSLIIVSQSFHLPRALFIARALGIPATGFVAPGGGVENALREIPASDKSVWDVLTRRVPEYLGTQIPITGNGQVTQP